MKAEVAQQRSLLELAKLDAELSRIAHRATHLPQREAYERMQAEHDAANDRLAAVRIAVEDLDAQVSRFESEIDAVRQREDRDRSLLRSGRDGRQATVGSAARAGDLATPPDQPGGFPAGGDGAPRGAAGPAGRRAGGDRGAAGRPGRRAAGPRRRARRDRRRPAQQHSSRRDALAATLDPDLSALYERQRAGGGPGAAPLQGHRCGACRIEIGRGELARITAAAEDEVVRCPECGAILLRVKAFEQ